MELATHCHMYGGAPTFAVQLRMISGLPTARRYVPVDHGHYENCYD